MSLTHVHVGQAGLQVAEPLWSLAHAHPSARTWWFDDHGHAHCVLVDSEPRVVRAVRRRLGAIVRDDSARVLNAHGCANNWAMGFSMIAEESLDGVLEAVRRSAERSDWWNGIVVHHSIAGGTGSGLGSRLLGELRELYDKQWLLSAAVLPFATGDSTLQHYNAALSLAHQHAHVDLALLFANTDMLGAHVKLAADKPSAVARASVTASLADLNQRIACTLAGGLLPLDNGGSRPRAADIAGLVASVAPLPSHKLAEAFSSQARIAVSPPAPAQLGRARSGHNVSSVRAHAPPAPSRSSWEQRTARLAQCMPRYHEDAGGEQRRVVTLSAQVVVRGADATELGPSCAKLDRILGPSPVRSAAADWLYAPTQRTAHAVDQTLTVIANRSSVTAHLARIIRRARAQLGARAYVHHYARYGCSAEVIEGHVNTLDDIATSYAGYVGH